MTAYYQRQEQRRAEVAVRTAPDKSVQRTARVQLRSKKALIRQGIETWLDTIADEDAHDRVQFQRQAVELAAVLRGYLPEIDSADNEAELDEVLQDINALINSPEGKTLQTEYQEAQQRVVQQQEAREWAAQYEQRQQQALAAQQERDRLEAERQRQAEARQAAAIAARKPRAITAGAGQPDLTYAGLLRTREDLMRRNGKCQFDHMFGAPASYRVVGTKASAVGMWEGEVSAWLCCPKHRQAAIQHVTNEGWPYYRVEDLRKPPEPEPEPIQGAAFWLPQ